MSLLITVEKLYFMDGIYRVTAQTEKPLNPDVNAYISKMDIVPIKPMRAFLTHDLRERLIVFACNTIVEEYRLVTSEQLDYTMKGYEISDRPDLEETHKINLTYPDYREAIEGVEGVYLTD